MAPRSLVLDGADFKGIGDERARIRPPSKRIVIMKPGDQRGFVHKKILGGISSLAGIAAGVGIPGAGFVGGAARFLGGGRGPATFVPPRGFTTGRTVPRTQTARVSVFSRAEQELGKLLKFGGPETPVTSQFTERSAAPGGGCIFPFKRDPASGRCKLFLGDKVGPDGNGGVTGPVGEAVMGRFGAGMVPGAMNISRAVCDRGMQLGIDGLCYNKGQITNSQRMWPRGRRPLLTGGDMRAIGIASRASKKLESTTKRLRSMGMMKALPSARRTHRHAQAATGVVSV